jgi:hypothetical protein
VAGLAAAAQRLRERVPEEQEAPVPAPEPELEAVAAGPPTAPASGGPLRRALRRLRGRRD